MICIPSFIAARVLCQNFAHFNFLPFTFACLPGRQRAAPDARDEEPSPPAPTTGEAPSPAPPHLRACEGGGEVRPFVGGW